MTKPVDCIITSVYTKNQVFIWIFNVPAGPPLFLADSLVLVLLIPERSRCLLSP
jgi:hypothetical protein